MALDYELLDTGNGMKIERFGNNIVARPEEQAAWPMKNREIDWNASAVCQAKERARFEWERTASFVEPWLIRYKDLTFELRYSQSKNIGIFPEQEDNWRFIENAIQKAKHPVSVLNLFAYTGAATLVAARAGANVCHVDASKSTVKWASNNAERSKIKTPIRWIVDDAQQFLAREIKRETQYDAVILDPPPFGRSQQGQFVFGNEIELLLRNCKKVLSAKPTFFILNSYAMGLRPSELRRLVTESVGNFHWQCGELTLQEATREKSLSCSSFARF